MQRTSDYSIEFVRQQFGARGTLVVEISFDCRGFEYKKPGLRLRDRERFTLAVGAEFPLEPPDVFAPDHCFAFHDHVYWVGDYGVWLCLYYSTEHQWQPTEGIAGFLWRLLQWLERASVGELDAPGQPRHPPLARGVEDDTFFVAQEDCPGFKYWWHGYAVLKKKGPGRFDVVEWTDDMQRHKTDTLAPAILLNATFLSEFPQFVGSLLLLLERAGVDAQVLALCLLPHAIFTSTRQPMYVVLGVAMRGPKGGASDQHLFVWRIPDRAANDLRNLCRRHKRRNSRTTDLLLTKGASIISEWAESTVPMQHCRIYDQRPAVSQRRDVGTAISSLMGKTVTLWGVGGLGSYIAEMLVRAGVGILRIVDCGRVNPGILVRQNYVDQDIGERKVDALTRRLQELSATITIEPISTNLLKDRERASQSLRHTDLLIDATASHHVAMTIDRYLLDQGPQQFPIVTLGNDIESERGLITFTPSNCPLGPWDLLYRAYLTLCEQRSESWLNAFWLNGSEDDWFEPEPGCSSPTYHGSGAQTASLAGSLLTEAAQLFADVSQPFTIGICPFNSKEPAVRLAADRGTQESCPAEGEEIRFFPQATKIIDETISVSEDNCETGGVLFGFRDNYLKVVWIVAATGPPPDSIGSKTSFVCGVEGVAKATNEWRNKTHQLVGFVGTWHSHPVSAPTPSVTDHEAMKALLVQSGSPLHRLVLTIVGYSASRPQIGTFIYNEDGNPVSLEQ